MEKVHWLFGGNELPRWKFSMMTELSFKDRSIVWLQLADLTSAEPEIQLFS
jgi:hypothetical protein